MVGKGFRLGRLYGITIRIDWSWLLILALITWNLTSVFGQVHQDWDAPLRWGISLAAALLFFASVLAHELAHSLVARAYGIPVRDITLFLFGGVASIEREPSSPKAEFLIAAAGPATSIVIGAAMLAIGVGSVYFTGLSGSTMQMLSRLSPLSTLLFWLGSTNIILAIFNLIPGFPLDGGRVLRSIIWALTRNLRTATRAAALVGQGIAWTMIIAGIAMTFGVRIPFLGTGLVSGVWLAFIGWFLNTASTRSYQQAALQDVLDGVAVSRLMRPNPPTVEPDCTITDLVNQHLMTTDDQAFPVIVDGALKGIITLDDVRRVPREKWDTTRVDEVMTRTADLVTVAPEEEASQAFDKLIQRDVRQLPVVGRRGPNGPELLGLLGRKEIMRWLQVHAKTQGQKPL